MKHRILLFLILALTAWSSMRVYKKIELNSESTGTQNSKFIARFSVPYGATLSSSFRLRFDSISDSSLNYPLSVLFFDDDQWNEAITTKSWEQSKSLAKHIAYVTLTEDGQWSSLESYVVDNISKNQVWYVVVSDCLGLTHAKNPNLPKIVVELHMLNSESEFSHEEYGIMTLNFLLLIIYLYFLLTTTYNLVITALRKDEIDNAKVGWIFAIYMELLHIAAQTVHLVIYSYNGQGFFILDVLSTVLQMNSQIVTVGLLILIAYGWEITDTDLSKNNNKFIILGGATLFLNSIIAFLTAIDDGEHHKYHDYGGLQGLILVIIRICLYWVFMYGVIKTFKKVPRKTQRFLKALSASGTMYMLTFPILWIFSFIITAHLRNRLIVYGNLGVQLFAIIIMLNQISKKGTKFKEASAKSKIILGAKAF